MTYFVTKYCIITMQKSVPEKCNCSSILPFLQNITTFLQLGRKFHLGSPPALSLVWAPSSKLWFSSSQAKSHSTGSVCEPLQCHCLLVQCCSVQCFNHLYNVWFVILLYLINKPRSGPSEKGTKHNTCQLPGLLPTVQDWQLKVDRGSQLKGRVCRI